MALEVKCNVDNCNYWQDSKCMAEDITVNMKNGEEVCNPDDTFCETFETKECQHNLEKTRGREASAALPRTYMSAENLCKHEDLTLS